MESPCLKCKRYPKCPNPCYPRMDYMKHLKKKGKKKCPDT